MSILSATALGIARTFIGTKETSPNRSPLIDEWEARFGVIGLPWCSMWLWNVFEASAKKTGLVNPYPKTASSLKVWTFTEPVCRDSNPTVGAVFVLRHTASKGHVGICESVLDGTPTCISANTFDGRGGREGNCVARHFGTPEVVHGGELLGWLVLDRAAQAPSVVA